MFRFLLATVAAGLLAACMSSTGDGVAGKAASAAASTSPATAKAKVVKPGTAAIPSEVAIPSSVGEVTFQHQVHTEDRAIGCVECHHQINAKKLNTPHPDYLQSSWINCKVCHDEPGKVKQSIYACSECHPTNPINIADETLSAKVVIHKQCWKCHPVNTGQEASTSCALCHSGSKTL